MVYYIIRHDLSWPLPLAFGPPIKKIKSRTLYFLLFCFQYMEGEEDTPIYI
jgi:hypothetical protein